MYISRKTFNQRSQSAKWTPKRLMKWQHHDDGGNSSSETCKSKRSLFRVGSDKYLVNNKCQKGNLIIVLISENHVFSTETTTDRGNLSLLRPKLNLRKKSFSVDTEMMFETEKNAGEVKNIEKFLGEF